MHESDGKRFRNLLRGMGRMYSGDLDNAVLDAYWIALRDWDYGEFEAAAAQLMATAKFMPRPAEFNALRKAGEPTPGEAWSDVLGGCELEPGSRAWRAAQAVGGQYAIRHADIERDLPHIQRRFIDEYDRLSAVDPIRDALPQIAARGAMIALTGPVQIANFLPKFDGEDELQP